MSEDGSYTFLKEKGLFSSWPTLYDFRQTAARGKEVINMSFVYIETESWVENTPGERVGVGGGGGGGRKIDTWQQTHSQTQRPNWNKKKKKKKKEEKKKEI